MTSINATWIAVYVLVISTFGITLWKRRNYLALVSAFAISMLTPVAKVGIDCMQNQVSEACVWGKAFLPPWLVIASFAGTPLAYLTITAVAIAAARIRQRHV
jgi:hypothetical protein